MGYEEEISIVAKSKVEAIRNLSPEEFVQYFIEHHISNDDDIADDLKSGEIGTDGIYFPAVARMLGESRGYSFGKYYENSGELIKLGTPFFTNIKTQEVFNDYCPCIIGKDAIANAIEFYRQKTAEYFKSLTLTEEDYKVYAEKHYCDTGNQAKRIARKLQQKYAEWADKDMAPYSLTGPTPVKSGLIEYEVFALVDLYRNTDWNNETGIFYGH